jgi:hypothetical protein
MKNPVPVPPAKVICITAHEALLYRSERLCVDGCGFLQNALPAKRRKQERYRNDFMRIHPPRLQGNRKSLTSCEHTTTFVY